MRTYRIYQPVDLMVNTTIELTPEAANHLTTVLRLKPGAEINLFNGRDNKEYIAIIASVHKKSVLADIKSSIEKNIESPLNLHIGQVISRGEKMDFTIQKAVELGVNEITPINSERCNVKLDEKRQLKRLAHWEKVIVSACEQSGRNFVPKLNPITHINNWVKLSTEDSKIILHPHVNTSTSLSTGLSKNIALLVGPEGGFSEAEVELATSNNFYCLQLGPRILRTETAALAAIAVLQSLAGDFVC